MPFFPFTSLLQPDYGKIHVLNLDIAIPAREKGKEKSCEKRRSTSAIFHSSLCLFV